MKASVRLCRSGSMDISLSRESEYGSQAEELKEFVQSVAVSEATSPTIESNERLLPTDCANSEPSGLSPNKSLARKPTLRTELLSTYKSCSSKKEISENYNFETQFEVNELIEPPSEFLDKGNGNMEEFEFNRISKPNSFPDQYVRSMSFEDDISAISNDEDTNAEFFEVDSLNGDSLEEKDPQEADQIEPAAKGLDNQNIFPNEYSKLRKLEELTDFKKMRTMLRKPMEEILRLDEKVSNLKADIQTRLARHMQHETETTKLISVDSNCEQDKLKEHLPSPLAYSHPSLDKTSNLPLSSNKKITIEHSQGQGQDIETELKTSADLVRSLKSLNLPQTVAGGSIKASGQHQVEEEQPFGISLNSDGSNNLSCNLYSFEEKSNMEPENEESCGISSPVFEAKDRMAQPKRRVVKFSAWKSSFDASFKSPEMETSAELSHRNRTVEIISMIESLNDISIEQFRYGRWDSILKQLKGIVLEQVDQHAADVTSLEKENERLSNTVQVLSRRLLNTRSEINHLRDETRDLEGKNLDLRYSLMSSQLKDQERIQKGICALRQALQES